MGSEAVVWLPGKVTVIRYSSIPPPPYANSGFPSGVTSAPNSLMGT